MLFTVSTVPRPSGSVFVLGIQINMVLSDSLRLTKPGNIYEKSLLSFMSLGRKLPILLIVVNAREVTANAIVSSLVR